MHSKWTFVLIALALAPAAVAQGRAQHDKNAPDLVTPYGMSAMVGGGVTNFIDPNATSITSLGGSWTARLQVGTRTLLGGELGYVGTLQNLDALGVDRYALLLSNGIEGMLRLNAFTGAWQPYAAAGLGLKAFSVQNTSTNTSSVLNSENVIHAPFALGVAYRYKGFVADGRFSISAPFSARMIPGSNLITWDAGAKVGWEF